MAIYGINQEGVDNLNQLSADLSRLNNDIEACGQKLITVTNGLSNELGIYEDEILELVAGVNSAQEKGRDSVEQLALKAKKLASEVESMVAEGLGQ